MSTEPKTDQYGDGQEVGICAAASPSLCALTAWRAWMALRAEARTNLPLFTAVQKNGVIIERHLSGKAIERLMKVGVATLKLPDAVRHTGHSLRSRDLWRNNVTAKVARSVEADPS